MIDTLSNRVLLSDICDQRLNFVALTKVSCICDNACLIFEEVDL